MIELQQMLLGIKEEQNKESEAYQMFLLCLQIFLKGKGFQSPPSVLRNETKGEKNLGAISIRKHWNQRNDTSETSQITN